MPPSDPFSDVDPIASSNRRKAAQRHRVLKPAKIARIDAKSLVDCQMRDISESGARLRCAAMSAVPNEFYLVFPIEGMRRQARVVWRRGEEIGVQFVSAKEPIPRRKG